jgi:hypothetical protein
MLKSPIPCEKPAMTKTEAKPVAEMVNELFSKSPDGLRELVRAVMHGFDGWGRFANRLNLLSPASPWR